MNIGWLRKVIFRSHFFALQRRTSDLRQADFFQKTQSAILIFNLLFISVLTTPNFTHENGVFGTFGVRNVKYYFVKNRSVFYL